MTQHFSFGSIEQFRHVVKSVRDRANFHSAQVPTIKFKGSVKLHGTSASVVLDQKTSEIWSQSRSNVITIEADNAGFARFTDSNMTTFKIMFDNAKQFMTQKDSCISIFGEWCGQGIQKGVAVSQVPKMFVVFGIKEITDRDNNTGIWLSFDQIDLVVSDVFGDKNRIFSANRFKTWTIDIDFKSPELAQNELIKITTEVENECPVGKFFGVSSVGEGVVWKAIKTTSPEVHIDDLIFKVKGEKHSDSKVKTLAAVDVERVNSIKEFADSVVTDHRLEKMVEKLKQEGGVVESQSIPAFLKLVGQDITKEETDTIVASGFTHKDVMPAVNRLARDWFIKFVKIKNSGII